MAKLTDFLGRPHTGIIPHAVIGIVVEDWDEAGAGKGPRNHGAEFGRVKVKFPTLHEEPISFWARMSAPDAGKDAKGDGHRGFWAMPEKGDEVLVTFVNGDFNHPVIVGQFWNGIDKPPIEAKDGLPGSGDTDTGGAWSTAKFTDGSTSLENNDRRLWRSRSGHLFVFDDTSGSETVQIWDQTHKLSFVFDSAAGLITLANNNADIHIRAKGHVFIEAGQDIKYKAGMNIKGEAGQNIDLKAGQNYKLEAGMAVDVKSGMDTTIKAGMNLTGKGAMNATIEGGMNFTGKGGLQAELKGGAMAVVKGAVVMIN